MLSRLDVSFNRVFMTIRFRPVRLIRSPRDVSCRVRLFIGLPLVIRFSVMSSSAPPQYGSTPLSQVSNAVHAWHQLVSKPLPTTARFVSVVGQLGSNNAIADAGSAIAARVVFEYTDVFANQKQYFEQRVWTAGAVPLPSYLLCAQLPNAVPWASVDKPPVPCFSSPSGRRHIRFVSFGAPPVQWRIELWDNGAPNSDVTQLTATFSSYAASTSGTGAAVILKAPLRDVYFQEVSWSHDESFVVFSGEVAPATTKSLADAVVSAPGTGSVASPFAQREHWGEAFTEYSHVGLFKLNLRAAADSSALKLLTPRDFPYFCASPVIVEHCGVVFLAYPETPYRRGVVHCSSRPNRLFLLPEEEDDANVASIASDQANPPRDITFCPALKCLKRRPGSNEVWAFAPCPTSGAHLSACSLVNYNVVNETVRTVVPIVQRVAPDWHADPSSGVGPRPAATTVLDGLCERPFPGLFPTQGRTDLMFGSAGAVFVGSVRYSSYVVYAVEANGGACTLLTPPVGTWRLQDVEPRSNRLLLLHSTALSPPSVVQISGTAASIGLLGPWSGATSRDIVDPDTLPFVDTLASPTDVARGRATLLRLRHGCQNRGHTEALFYAPAKADRGDDAKGEEPDNRPCVVLLHGGPHGTDTSAYVNYVTFWVASRGWKVLSVNYTGSLGFGQQPVDELCGRIGDTDVTDALAYIDAVRERRLVSPTAPLAVAGGSHGGFLACHLVGRFPTLFRAAVIRNPVTSLQSMIYETDIDDWCVVEAGSDDAKALAACSPMQYAGGVEAAVILGLGLDDQRVPVAQGRSWAKRVRQRGRKDMAGRLVVLEYPDVGHDLMTPTSENDFHVHAVLFLDKHLAAL